MCWRCCCWRAGPTSPTSAAANAPLDVAPLLESIGSLETAGELLRALHAEPAYRGILPSRGNRQAVVIGYSDTNKQGGIAASRWALQVAQTQLLDGRARGRHRVC